MKALKSYETSNKKSFLLYGKAVVKDRTQM